MPDVGVLNLQIHENSSQAETGLNKVAGALNRIKSAVNGSGLKSVVSSLKGINKAINDFRVDGTIENLNGVASALKRVKDACDFTIPSLKGFGNVKKILEQLNGQGIGEAARGMAEMGTGAAGAGAGIEKMNEGLRETVSLMNQMKWAFGGDGAGQFQSMFNAWSDMRSGMALGAGNLGLPGGSAIPAEGWVEEAKNEMLALPAATDEVAGRMDDAFERIDESISYNPEPVQEMNDGIQSIGEAAQETASKVGDAFEQIKASYRFKPDPLPGPTGENWFEKSPKTMAEIQAEAAEDRMRTLYHFISNAKSPEEANLYAQNAGTTVEAVKNHFKDIETVRQQIQSLFDTLNQPIKTNFAEVVNQINGIGQEAKSAEDSMKVFLEKMGDNTQTAQSLRENNPELAEFKERMSEAGVSASDFSSKLVGLDGELKSKKTDAAEASGAISKMAAAMDKVKGIAGSVRDGFHSLGKAISKLPLVQLGKQFLNIAKRMAIRAAIKALTSAFKEGVENVYKYSEAIGSSFATSMDNAKASLMTMKNSIGAAVAPAIQALIPVLQTVVSWVITAANAINQLLSLLSGKTSWTKAVDQGTAALDKQKKAAAGAGGAVKDMLAAWDELNVISNDGGGGGGGGAAAAATDFAGMFEEVTEFDGWIADLTGKIKDIVTWCEEHMESVKGIAIAIGAAILGWKLATGFEGWLSKLGQWIALGAVIALTLQATWHLTNQYLKTGDEGWLWASALTGAVGATAAGVIAQKLIGGKAGLYTASFVLILSGLTNIVAAIKDVNVNGITDKNIKVAILGALGIGAGTTLAMIAGGFAIGTAAIAGVIVTGLVFAATVGMMAIVDANRTKFKWGDIQLTEEEAKRFALQKMFDVDVEANIAIISANVTTGSNLRSDIELDLRNMLTDMRIINLGIADTDDYSKLNQDVDSVIAHIKDYVKNAKETGALTLELTPTLVGETTGEQNEWFTSYNQGWNKVQDFYEKKGKQIADCFVTSETGEIKLKSPELLQTLMSEMEKVTAAIANSKVASEAYANFAISMGDLSETSAQNVAKYFKQYKEDLEKQYTSLVNEQYQKQGQLVAALGEIDKNSKEYKEALKKYEEMGKNLNKAVQDGVASATGSGQALIEEWLNGHVNKINAGSVSNMWKTWLRGNNITSESLEHAMQQILVDANVPTTVLDIMDMVEISGWDYLDDDLKKSMFDTVFEAIGEEAVPLLARSLKIPVEDVMSITKWGDFTNKQQASFILAIGEAYGGSAALQAAKNAGVDLGTVIGDGLSSTDGATKEKAQALVQSIRETLAASGVEVPVDASVDVLVNAMVEVEATSTTAKIQNVASSAQAKVNAITGALSDIVNRVKKITGHANGAYDIPSGELFMARENGITEYVGSIGGKASVANNDQIEEGISKGVAKANEEQNALLREQNNLLRRILAKELKVDLGSKASFGRTVRQSLDAYESMAGV